jgi:diguanylate cyclase (GGDEF)-like protein
MGYSGSWLCPSEMDRERLRDMAVRVKPARMASMGVLAVSLLVGGPWMGFWTLIPLALALVGFAIIDRRLTTDERPEFGVAAAWCLAQLLIAASVALTGDVHSPAIGWFAIPIVTLSARFNKRGVWAGLAFTLTLLLASTVAVDPRAFLDAPQHVTSAIAIVVAVAILSTALMSSELEHRTGAVLDPLTGLFNRAALEQRFAELAHQASITGASVGMVIGDLDNFKEINDTHGHARGDAVLRDAAYAMRKALRSFDLLYRLGGEEFVVLLPDATTTDARRVAEHLRTALAFAKPGGLAVSISLGVASASGADVTFAQLFEDADRALYEAKQRGRNQVWGAGDDARPPRAMPALRHSDRLSFEYS